jgi:hypothetical protein
MGLFSIPYLRRLVLGLMFFLAGTASCWSDAYDPDPYDSVPPVVTVEFNYVMPAQASIQISRAALRYDLKALRNTQEQQTQPPGPRSIHDRQVASVFQGTPPTFLPLRR